MSETVTEYKPNVTITSEALLKVMALVMSNKKEVGWYGAVTNSNGVYVIYDIKVYPQIVNGAHISLKEPDYSKWSAALEDDFFNHRRFHGHSHVNMSVTFSGTDIADQTAIVEDLAEDDFYIFATFNKNLDINCSVYEGGKRYDKVPIIMPYETNDVLEESKRLVEEEVYIPQPWSYTYYPNEDVKKKTSGQIFMGHQAHRKTILTQCTDTGMQ